MSPFTIRGYVAGVREKDEKIGYPFPTEGVVLPPLEGPDYRVWTRDQKPENVEEDRTAGKASSLLRGEQAVVLGSARAPMDDDEDPEGERAVIDLNIDANNESVCRADATGKGKGVDAVMSELDAHAANNMNGGITLSSKNIYDVNKEGERVVIDLNRDANNESVCRAEATGKGKGVAAVMSELDVHAANNMNGGITLSSKIIYDDDTEGERSVIDLNRDANSESVCGAEATGKGKGVAAVMSELDIHAANNMNWDACPSTVITKPKAKRARETPPESGAQEVTGSDTVKNNPVDAGTAGTSGPNKRRKMHPIEIIVSLMQSRGRVSLTQNGVRGLGIDLNTPASENDVELPASCDKKGKGIVADPIGDTPRPIDNAGLQHCGTPMAGGQMNEVVNGNTCSRTLFQPASPTTRLSILVRGSGQCGSRASEVRYNAASEQSGRDGAASVGTSSRHHGNQGSAYRNIQDRPLTGGQFNFGASSSNRIGDYQNTALLNNWEQHRTGLVGSSSRTPGSQCSIYSWNRETLPGRIQPLAGSMADFRPKFRQSSRPLQSYQAPQSVSRERSFQDNSLAQSSVKPNSLLLDNRRPDSLLLDNRSRGFSLGKERNMNGNRGVQFNPNAGQPSSATHLLRPMDAGTSSRTPTNVDSRRNLSGQSSMPLDHHRLEMSRLGYLRSNEPLLQQSTSAYFNRNHLPARFSGRSHFPGANTASFPAQVRSSNIGSSAALGHELNRLTSPFPSREIIENDPWLRRRFPARLGINSPKPVNTSLPRDGNSGNNH